MTNFNNHCLDTLHASSAKDYLARLVDFAHNYDFRFISAIVIVDHSATLTQFSSITNVPTGYLSEFSDAEGGLIDPVSQHCKQFSTPIVWDALTYATKGRSSLWEIQAAFGLKEGISAAMHLPHGKHFFFGVDGDVKLKQNPKQLERMTMDFLMYMSYAQAAAFELVNGDTDCARGSMELSWREVDALKYIKEGFTIHEIANKVGTSERSIELRLSKAMHSLNCSTRYQAVLRAMRLGYIDF